MAWRSKHESDDAKASAARLRLRLKARDFLPFPEGDIKLDGAGREVARFAINSTVGVGGLFDVAEKGFNIEPSDRDTGQTLGKYGVSAGPYLVLPFLPPFTVRDFFGFVADTAMHPLSYFIPIGATIGLGATQRINERAQMTDKTDGIEEDVIDLYGSVRNAYLQHRAAELKR